MALVGAPIVGVIAGNVEGLKQGLQLLEDLIFTPTKNIRQYRAGVIKSAVFQCIIESL